jgi:Tfp pilus assembly protein PilO
MARVGWLPVVVAGLLAVALAAQFVLLPILQEKTQVIQRSLADLQTGSQTSPHAHELAARYKSFRSQLAKTDERGALLKLLFKTGSDAGITLSQAEYQWRADAACGCLAMQMVLPIKGGYVPIRRFLDNVLVSLPAVSLDEISFRRSTVKASGIEAQLRLTLYFADGS